MTAMVKYNSADVTSVEYFSDTLIDEFIASRHSSPNTAKTYRNACRQMLKFFAAQGIVTPMTADVDSFFNSLRAAKKSVATLRLYSTVAKLYFAFLQKKGVYRDIAADAEPLKLRKSSTHNKKALTPAQAKKLLSAVKGDNLIARRDRAVIALALQTGVRTCEIARANVKDFQQDAGFWTLAVQGKGRLTADEIVKVAEPVAALINAYLSLRGDLADDAPLFASTSRNNSKYGDRYSEQSVGKMIKARMKAVGIDDKKITAHSTRHFAATTAIQAGVDIREVGAMLRHSSIVVTSTYLHDLSVASRRAELSVAESLFGGVA